MGWGGVGWGDGGDGGGGGVFNLACSILCASSN